MQGFGMPSGKSSADRTSARAPIASSVGLAGRPGSDARGAAYDAVVYTSAVYGAQVLLFVAGLLQKGILGPTRTGYWALMVTTYSFFGLASGGIFHGAVRQVPAYRGVGEYGDAASSADTAGTISVLSMAVLGTIVAAVSLAMGGDWAPELQYGLVALGLTAPLRALSDVHDLLLQVTKRFAVLSWTVLIRAVVVLLAQTALVLALGFWGMFAGLVAATLSGFVYWNLRGLAFPRAAAFRFRVDGGRAGELLRVGLPILVYSQIWLLFASVDSLIVARFADVTSLGYYALAVSVTSYVMLLPNSIATTIFPRMQEQHARREHDAVRKYVVDIQTVLGLVLVPLFIAAVFFGLPVLIRHALPAFVPSVLAVQIMVAGSFSLALVQIPIEYLITTNRRWQATVIMVVCLVVNGAANFVAVAILHRGVPGAAVATIASYGFVFIVTTTYALVREVDGSKLLAHTALLAVAGAYTVGLLWGIDAVLGRGRDLADDVGLALAKFAILAVMLSPLLYIAERRYGAIRFASKRLALPFRGGKAR
jgi:O-antigen/teichoic acid export membrane protein